jgi:outer membrane protein
MRAALLLAALLPALASAPLAAQTEGPGRELTLQEAARLAVAANPSLLQAKLEEAAAAAQVKESFALVLPKIEIQGQNNLNSEEVEFGDLGQSTTVLPRTDWQLRLALTQPLFAGFRERKTYLQSKVRVESAASGVAATREALLLALVGEYLGLVRGEALVAVEEQNVDLARRRQSQAQDLLDAGEVTRVDVLRAGVAVKAAERQRALADRTRQTALSRLREMLAWDRPTPIRAATPALPGVPPEAQLIRRAVDRRPELAQSADALEIARLEVGKQKGKYLPTLFAEGAWVRQKSDFPTSEYGFIGLRFSMPIFQGGSTAAAVAQAELRQEQVALGQEDARRQVVEQVRRALVDLDTAETLLRLGEEQLAAAEVEYAQVFDLYRALEVTALEVEAAELTLAEARRDVVNGRVERELARATIWYAAGGLTEALLPGLGNARGAEPNEEDMP